MAPPRQIARDQVGLPELSVLQLSVWKAMKMAVQLCFEGR